MAGSILLAIAVAAVLGSASPAVAKAPTAKGPVAHPAGHKIA